MENIEDSKEGPGLASALIHPQDASSKPAVKPWSVGKAVGILTPLTWLALCLGQQTVLSAQQWLEERQAGPRLEAMRAEQAWLVGQGLAPKRALVAGVDVGGKVVSGERTLDGWRAISALWLADALAEKVGLRILSRGPVIYSGAEGASQIEEAPSGTYRHEEGHARMNEGALLARRPKAWPAGAGELLVAKVNAVEKADREGVQTQRNWREQWMSKLRAEAFADAFACLSKARAGAQAYREEALRRHASRAFGDLSSSVFKSGSLGVTMSSMVVVGEPHAVDMASFLAGQFDASSVAKLDARGLDDLAGQVADASLAWALARQGRATGFFAPEGASWWAQNVAGGARGKALWQELRDQSLAQEPAAAFGRFEFKAGGMVFGAEGLPSRPLAYGARWRFDGMGGVSGWTPGVEPGAGGPLAQGKLVMAWGGGAADADPRLAKPEKFMWQMSRAREGAIWTHWALARKLGADPVQEAKRVEARLTGMGKPGTAQELFELWEDAMGQLDALDAKASKASKAAKQDRLGPLETGAPLGATEPALAELGPKMRRGGP